jgi:hypothetical protein
MTSRRWAAVGYVSFYGAVAAVLVLVFANAMYTQADGIYTGVANDLGDLPFHLQVTSGFLYGHNFPPEHPEFAGVRFAYPFLCDFLTAMLAGAGAPLSSAMFLQNLLLALAMVGLLHYWTVQLTGDRLAGVIAPLLVLFSGGLGWWLLFGDLRANEGGIIGLLEHLPRSYTIENAPNALLRWGNSLTTLFIPQRSILFGAPLSLVIFSLWWLSIGPDTNGESPARIDASENEHGENKHGDVITPSRSQSRRRGSKRGEVIGKSRSKPMSKAVNRKPMNRYAAMVASGVFAGMLPLIHTHSFMVVMMIGGCLALLFPNWRLWASFLAAALAIAVPEMLWSVHGSTVHFRQFVGWSLGWDRGDANAVWFWLVNTGAFIPLLVTAIFWRSNKRKLVAAPLLRFYLPFLLCFVIPNLVRLAPWDWDNIKVLFYWYLGSVPLVALLLSTWMRERRTGVRWSAVALLGCLILAGALDVIRVVSGMESIREFDSDGVAIAADIIRQTAPRAVVLHAPTYNSPVFLTGRRSLLGYTATVLSHGIEYEAREDDILEIYTGGAKARTLLQQYGVDYVLVSPMERSQLSVNDGFWGQFAVVAQAGEYRLYKVESGNERGSEQQLNISELDFSAGFPENPKVMKLQSANPRPQPRPSYPGQRAWRELQIL